MIFCRCRQTPLIYTNKSHCDYLICLVCTKTRAHGLISVYKILYKKHNKGCVIHTHIVLYSFITINQYQYENWWERTTAKRKWRVAFTTKVKNFYNNHYPVNDWSLVLTILIRRHVLPRVPSSRWGTLMVACLCSLRCFIAERVIFIREHGVFLLTRCVTANGVSGLWPLQRLLGIKVHRVTYE